MENIKNFLLKIQLKTITVHCIGMFAKHYENMPKQYTEIFKVVKIKIFRRKLLIFFLFLLKT